MSRVLDLVRASFGAGPQSEATATGLLGGMMYARPTDPERSRIESGAALMSSALRFLIEGQAVPFSMMPLLDTARFHDFAPAQLRQALDLALGSLARSYPKREVAKARRGMIDLLEGEGLRLKTADGEYWEAIGAARRSFRQPAPALRLGIVESNSMTPTPRLSVRHAVRRSLGLAG